MESYYKGLAVVFYVLGKVPYKLGLYSRLVTTKPLGRTEQATGHVSGLDHVT